MSNKINHYEHRTESSITISELYWQQLTPELQSKYRAVYESEIESIKEADEVEDGMWSDEDDDIDDDFEPDEIDEAIDECGQMADGGCMLVGTEFCDWECPFSKEMWNNLTKKRD